jgi:hypothetical protein
MRFLKIKYANGLVSLKYENRQSETDSSSTEREVREEPTPEFQAALAGFKPHLRKLTGIKDKEWLDKAIITGVRLSYSKEGDRRGYMVSMTRSIDASDSPVNLTTPLIYEEEEAEDAVGEQIEALIEEARLFLKGARAQLSLDDAEQKSPEGSQQDLEDAIEAEQEATRRIRQQQGFEVRSALVGALPDLPAGWSAEGTFRPDDDDLAELIADAWDDVEIQFEGNTYAGFYRHETADHQVVWCWLRSGINPGFFYSIAAPDAFDPFSALPTYDGKELLQLARSLYYPGDTVAAASIDVEKQAQESEETGPAELSDYPTCEGFRKATRPAAEPGDVTTLLMQGIHTLIFEGDSAGATWLEFWHDGATSEQLETAIRGAFLLRGKGDNRFGISEPLGMNGSEPVTYEVVEFTMDPLSAATGKGKKKQKLEGHLLVDAVRSMLQIPDASEQETPEASVAVEVGAGAGDAADTSSAID